MLKMIVMIMKLDFKRKKDRFDHLKLLPLKLFKKIDQLFHSKFHGIIDYIASSV